MDEKIINELKEVVAEFDKGECILDMDKIKQNQSLWQDNFETTFPMAMHRFKLASKPKIENYTGNSVAYQVAITEYTKKCKDFHLHVTTAKTLDLIIKKIYLEELKKYKEKCSDLEVKLQEEKLKNETLIDKNGFLRGKLDMYERDIPKEDTLEGGMTSV